MSKRKELKRKENKERQEVYQPGVLLPTFSHEMPEASAIPIVHAVAVEQSIEGGGVELPRRYEEDQLRRQLEGDEVISTIGYLPDNPARETSESNQGKRNIIVGLMFVGLIIAAVAGVCLTGNCSRAAPRSEADAISIRDFINSITLASGPLSYPSQASPQERALQWLIDKDLTTNVSDTLAQRQRFALATMWFANGPFDSPIPIPPFRYVALVDGRV